MSWSVCTSLCLQNKTNAEQWVQSNITHGAGENTQNVVVIICWIV